MPVRFSLNSRESHAPNPPKPDHHPPLRAYPNRASQLHPYGQVNPHLVVAHRQASVGWLGLLAILLSFLAWLVFAPWLIWHSSGDLSVLLKLTNFTLTSRSLEALASIRQPHLKQTAEGVTNFLIVGIDTRENDKSGLRNTDTIILASYHSKQNQLTLVSFPRDILVQYPDTSSYGKINSVYQTGERRKAGQGLPYLQKTLEGITDQPIHYYVMINLKGFEEIIDQVGGITITVDNPFTDYAYPTDNYGYQTVTFKKGEQHMDGRKALQFARSRHGTNGEASDYARARRQQKVIGALTEKVKSSETLQNPVKVYDIFKTLTTHIVTSPLTPEDIQAGLNLIPQYKDLRTYNLVLDPLAGNSTLMQEGGAGFQFGFHIIPQQGLGKWSRVQKFLQTAFTNPDLVKANPIIYVYYSGDPKVQADYDKMQGGFSYLPIYYGGVSGLSTKGKTLYNLHPNKNQGVLQYLADQLQLTYSTVSEKGDIPQPKNVDAVILLGK